MYIVWDRLPIKGRGGGPFLPGGEGGPGADFAPPWRGLRCEHHGGRRVEWTPLLVEDDRRDGQLRQSLLFRLPAIRSCCIEDELHRAAWWHDVDWAIRLWGELGDGPLAEALAGDRSAILADLRAVVRKPSPAGLRDFAAFRGRREAEDQARDDANRAYWAGQVGQHRREAAEVRDRRPADCFAALGLRADATLDQVKARHRTLAMQHHPDRGGDPAQFRKVQDAYERALADLARRAAS